MFHTWINYPSVDILLNTYKVLSCNVQYLYSGSLTILTHIYFIPTENEIKNITKFQY